MNDLNLCQFIGRLGQSPEMRYTTSGDAIASFSIACGSQWKDKATGDKKEATEWVSCTAFGKLAEIIGEYLDKGSQVYVSGRIKTDKYEKDGQTRYSTKIIVDTMQMLGGKREGEQASTEQRPASSAKPAAAPSGGGSFDDDIPFNYAGSCGLWRSM